MEQPNHFVIASYQSTGIKRYDGNPFIEALPPILSVAQAGNSIKGKVDFHPSERLSIQNPECTWSFRCWMIISSHSHNMYCCKRKST